MFSMFPANTAEELGLRLLSILEPLETPDQDGSDLPQSTATPRDRLEALELFLQEASK